MLDYSDHPLSDEENHKLGTQEARLDTIFYPPNIMRITLNSQKDVFVVDNDLMTTEKEIIERSKQDNLTPVIYRMKTDKEANKHIASNANKEVINLINGVRVTKDKGKEPIISKSNEDIRETVSKLMVIEEQAKRRL